MSDDITTKPDELWEALETTDPRYVKDFQRTGGFKGTAIDPMWRCKRLTEVLGPCGIGWGWTIEDDRIVGSDQPIHYVRINFWFNWGEQRGNFDAYGCTPVMMKRRDGFMPDEEFAKKSLTDAIMSAAVRIGMSADVYLGEFDSDKYGSTRGQESSSAPRQQPQRSTPRPAPKNASPSQQGGKAGKGGPNQDCPKCGYDGITPRNFDASTNRPDLECPGDGQGGPPCIGREKNTGGHWPMGWYSWDRGTEPTNAAASRAAVDAQRPQDGPPVDAYDDDIPF